MKQWPPLRLGARAVVRTVGWTFSAGTWAGSVWAPRGSLTTSRGVRGLFCQPGRQSYSAWAHPCCRDGWLLPGWGHGRRDGDKNRTPKHSSCLVSLCPLWSLVGVVCSVPTQLWLKLWLHRRDASLGRTAFIWYHRPVSAHRESNAHGNYQLLGRFKCLKTSLKRSILSWWFWILAQQ